MLLSVVGVAAPEVLGAFSSLSGVMVDVDGDREKVLVKGPKWVSFNSVCEIISIPCLCYFPTSGEVRSEQQGEGRWA